MLKLAKKIINLLKASIFYIFLPPPNLTAPRTIEYRSPCVPRRSYVLSNPLPITSAFIWLVVACSRQLAAAESHDEFRFIHFFARNPMAGKTRRRRPLLPPPCAPSLPSICQRYV